MTNPVDVITEIRRSWGVGLPESIDPAARSAIENLRQQMGNSLALLSDQLYQSESHFFLELLQNADDNEYHPGTEATLTVDVWPTRIVLQNNERGFTAEEVRALCGVGNSTKKTRKAVKIGEKGVGFKAVFQVSDCPEVHSAGFHFRFNRPAYGDLGLVIPEWCGTGGLGEAASGTSIVLPLREGRADGFALHARLRPELLLFLRQLRHVMVHDHVSDKLLEIRRTGDGNLVEVASSLRHAGTVTPQSSRFFVHRRSVAMEDVTEKLRPDICDTEVVVALPMTTSGEADDTARRPVFAFLPVTDAGLQFVCHADFVLVTNREEVLKSRPWNERLRNELGVAFAESILKAQSVPGLGRTALRFLTDASAMANEFYRPVLSLALERLKSAQCVPVEGGGWSLPSAAVRRDQGGLSRLVDAGSLAERLSKTYVDADATGIGVALALLGCGTFGVPMLCACLRDQAWAKSKPAEWFGKLYASLARRELTPGEHGELKSANVLLLADGSVAPGGAKSVFRSLGKKTAYGFEEELRLLHPRALETIEKGAGDAVRKLLGHWGVRDANPGTIIDDHILPLHAGEEWKSRAVAALMGHARYVRDHLDEYLKLKGDAGAQAAAVEKLSDALYIRTAQEGGDTTYFNHAGALYVARGFGDPWNLRELLGERIGPQSISSAYVSGSDKEALSVDRDAWRKFFARLDGSMLPRVAQEGTGWAPSPELQELMRSDRWDAKARLLSLLDANWSYYGRFLEQQSTGRRWSPPTASSFLRQLQAMVVKTEGGETAQLLACYLKTEENLAVFGPGMPYLAGRWDGEGFLTAAGVVTRPTVAQVIERLDKIGYGSEMPAKELKQEVSRLYKFLESRFESHQQEIAGAFAAKQIVLLPATGGWCTLEDCCWSAPRELDGYAPAHGLHSAWREMETFFCEKLGVRGEMTPAEWVTTLERLAADEELDAERGARLALKAYRGLEPFCEQALSSGDEGELEWVRKLRSGTLIFTRRGEWWCNDGNVYLADDPTLEEMFGGHEGLAFAGVSNDDLPGVRGVFEVLRVRRVSEAVEVTPPPARGGLEEPGVSQRVAERWIFLTRFMWHKSPNTAYRAGTEDGRLGGLRVVRAYSYSPLVMTAELHGRQVERPFTARCDLDDSGAWLYIDRERSSDWDEIGRELCRVLRLPEIDGFTVSRLLSARNIAECESVLRTFKVGDLPEEEWARWRGSGGEGVQDDEALAVQETDATSQGIDQRTDGELARIGPAIDGPTTADGGPEEASEVGAENPGAGEAESPPNAGEHGGGASPSDNGQPHAGGAVTANDGRDTRGAASRVGTAGGQADGGDTEGESDDGAPGHSGRSGGQWRGGPPGTSTAPPTTPDRQSAGARSPSGSQERLVSYVAGGDGDHGDEFGSNHEERQRVGAAAVEFVLAEEERAGRKARRMRHDNPGFDVESQEALGLVRYVEVKGLSGEWGFRGVTLTAAQFKFAREHAAQAWLYVVEYATDPAKRRLSRIRNPALRATRFAFDHGWRSAAEPELSATRAAPVEGAAWTLADGRTGVVVAIDGVPPLRGIRVRLEDGLVVREVVRPTI